MKEIKEIMDFMNECGVFFVSTVEGNLPKVRPFSFVMEYDGKLCFATTNQKPIFAQLTANNNVEISCSTPICDGKWMRLSGNAVFMASDTARGAKEKALEVMPMLKHWYSVDDGIFEVFYIENGVANFYSLKGDFETIKF